MNVLLVASFFLFFSFRKIHNVSISIQFSLHIAAICSDVFNIGFLRIFTLAPYFALIE